MPYREHIFVCLNQRPDGDPKGCCLSRGAQALFDQLRAETRGHKAIRVNKASCLGQCEHGPVVVRYPAGVWLMPATVEGCKALAKEVMG